MASINRSLMPEVMKRANAPSPSGTPSAAYRAPPSSRAAWTRRWSTGSTSRSAAIASTTSDSARKAGDSGTAQPYAPAGGRSSARGRRPGSDLRLEDEDGDPPRRGPAGVGGEARVGVQG